MKFEESFAVPHDRGRVWEYFRDLERVARCVPGVEELTPLGDDVYRVRATQRVGALYATFALRMELGENETPSYMEFSAVGKSVKGAAGTLRARNRVEFADAAGGGTQIGLTSDVALGGMLGSVGHGAVAAKAREVTEQFAAALREDLDRWATERARS